LIRWLGLLTLRAAAVDPAVRGNAAWCLPLDQSDPKQYSAFCQQESKE
jgi:hypothetical protein